MKLEQLKSVYKIALSELERGEFQKVSEIVQMLRSRTTQNDLINMVRLLISARLSFKQISGSSDLDNLLNQITFSDLYFQAETAFVKGLYAFHRGLYADGAQDFANAKEYYTMSKETEKSLLSEYNQFIGLLNSESLNHLQTEEWLELLERKSLEIESIKVLGLVLRQKSFHLEQCDKITDALEAAEKGLPLIMKNAPLSDQQLLQLQIVTLHWQLNNRQEALILFENILAPFERRVLFSKDFVEAIINEKILPSPENYEVVYPHWYEKWRRFKTNNNNNKILFKNNTIIWDTEYGQMLHQDRVICKISLHSLEGMLIKILQTGPCTRTMLCETLWPQFGESEHIVDRFKKVLSRIRNKAPGLIINKNHVYQLSSKITAA